MGSLDEHFQEYFASLDRSGYSNRRTQVSWPIPAQLRTVPHRSYKNNRRVTREKQTQYESCFFKRVRAVCDDYSVDTRLCCAQLDQIRQFEHLPRTHMGSGEPSEIGDLKGGDLVESRHTCEDLLTRKHWNRPPGDGIDLHRDGAARKEYCNVR